MAFKALRIIHLPLAYEDPAFWGERQRGGIAGYEEDAGGGGVEGNRGQVRGGEDREWREDRGRGWGRVHMNVGVL